MPAWNLMPTWNLMPAQNFLLYSKESLWEVTCFGNMKFSSGMISCLSLAGVEIRFICSTGHFLVLMKITLQFNCCNLGFPWCSKSPIWSSSFIASFHHFSYKERPDLQKINLFTLIQYFSQKIPSSTVILFPAPLKSKAVQGSQFRKASILRVTQCHHTQTLHEIQSLWFIRLRY